MFISFVAKNVSGEGGMRDEGWWQNEGKRRFWAKKTGILETSMNTPLVNNSSSADATN
jgi:hypothetical protein